MSGVELPVMGLLVDRPVPPGMVRLVSELRRWCRPQAVPSPEAPPVAWLASSPTLVATLPRSPTAVWVENIHELAVLEPGAVVATVTANPGLADVPGCVIVPETSSSLASTAAIPPFLRARQRRAAGLPPVLVLRADRTSAAVLRAGGVDGGGVDGGGVDGGGVDDDGVDGGGVDGDGVHGDGGDRGGGAGDGGEAAVADHLLPTALAVASAVAVTDPGRLLQALAWGAPCVTTASVAAQVFARPGAEVDVVPGPDPAGSALAAAAFALADDPLRAAALGRAGRRLVERRHDLAWAAETVAGHLGLRVAAPNVDGPRMVVDRLRDLRTPSGAHVFDRALAAVHVLEVST